MTDPARPATALDLARALPKAELHIHIEGTLEPEQMFALADRNAVSLPYRDIAAVRKAFEFDSLQSFLDVYYQGLGVLQTADDFRDLTLAYLARAASDNIVHVELFFDPQAHTERGIALPVVMDGLLAGLAEGATRHGITWGLIPCFLRHLPEASAFDTLAALQPYLTQILGFGLDSSERHFPPSRFERVFEAVAALGLRRVAHAGEEGPPDYIRQALDLLGAERIDHGVAAIDDPALVASLADRRIPLTMCPLSNVRTAVTPQLRDHPLKRLLHAGVNVTINSDDPAYFDGYLVDNFEAAIDALALTRDDVLKLVRNSFEGSFLPQDQKTAWIDRLPI